MRNVEPPEQIVNTEVVCEIRHQCSVYQLPADKVINFEVPLTSSVTRSLRSLVPCPEVNMSLSN